MVNDNKGLFCYNEGIIKVLFESPCHRKWETTERNHTLTAGNKGLSRSSVLVKHNRNARFTCRPMAPEYVCHHMSVKAWENCCVISVEQRDRQIIRDCLYSLFAKYHWVSHLWKQTVWVYFTSVKASWTRIKSLSRQATPNSSKFLMKVQIAKTIPWSSALSSTVWLRSR